MGGAVPPLPHAPSWRGAQLGGSTGTTSPFTFFFFFTSTVGLVIQDTKMILVRREIGPRFILMKHLFSTYQVRWRGMVDNFPIEYCCSTLKPTKILTLLCIQVFLLLVLFS
jgi:hypothetical protein